MATYLIGDIQGCYDPLMRLLDHIRFDPWQDRLWIAGDIINRGPDSLKVLRLLSQLPAHHQTVLGNHDLYFLSVVLAGQIAKPHNTLAELYASAELGPLSEWLRRQPLALYDATYNTLLVHAGVAPTWTRQMTLDLAAEVSQQLQDTRASGVLQHLFQDNTTAWHTDLSGQQRSSCILNYLTRGRICQTDGTLDLAYKRGLADIPPGWLPWYRVPQRQTLDTRIVFGHWAALMGDCGGAFGVEAIDTGCVWGNDLTAFRLEDGQRFQCR